MIKWSRSKAKGLSLLALFALALQFYLSFGHFHHDLAADIAAVTPSQSSTSNTGHDEYIHHDLCAVCATVVAMAHTLVDTAPPVLPVPLNAQATEVVADSAYGLPATRLVAFQSRAPPRS